ncbi:MAG: ThiF family adenylyltransferase, partial [Acidobacteriales bacterium]|nr:ThiF family adenylyltransferase [Terriglobales bacterium]
ASDGTETVKFEVDVERPQKRAAPIAKRELIAARFRNDQMPRVYALRPGFPDDAVHTNLGFEGQPPWLCLDERPWTDARTRFTAFQLIERIRWWLSATARGDLHADEQGPEALFAFDMTLVVPAPVIWGDWPKERALHVVSGTGTVRPHTVVMREAAQNAVSDGFFCILLEAEPQTMRRLRNAPQNLAQLDAALSAWGVHLSAKLRSLALDFLESSPQNLAARPLILLRVPLLRPDGSPTGQADLKAFTTVSDSFEAIGLALGVFLPAGEAATGNRRVARSLTADPQKTGENVATSILSVQADYCREVAAAGSGFAADTRRVTIVGAGALGSHLIEIMRRDGFGTWTIVDNDALLPHNVQRHRLGADLVGRAKASAMAVYLDAFVTGSRDETKAICADVTGTGDDVIDALRSADIVIDTSASVTVSRWLSDLDMKAPRLTAFYSPSGKDAVFLGEDPDRAVTADALEAQYYRAILEVPALNDHLSTDSQAYHYSGSCRAVSFRMSVHAASTLSGLLASEIHEHLKQTVPNIIVWRKTADQSIQRVVISVHKTTRHALSDWQVVVDAGLISTARQYRKAALPAETGGILLGTIDVYRRQICLVAVVPAPPDSRGDEEGFERGVKNLKSILADASRRTAGQVEYVGEWHSHPAGVPPKVSGKDMKQLVWLGLERALEDIPALMLIIADDDHSLNFAVAL